MTPYRPHQTIGAATITATIRPPGGGDGRGRGVDGRGRGLGGPPGGPSRSPTLARAPAPVAVATTVATGMAMAMAMAMAPEAVDSGGGLGAGGAQQGGGAQKPSLAYNTAAHFNARCGTTVPPMWLVRTWNNKPSLAPQLRRSKLRQWSSTTCVCRRRSARWLVKLVRLKLPLQQPTRQWLRPGPGDKECGLFPFCSAFQVWEQEEGSEGEAVDLHY
jgi:hypothetical protein